MEFADRVSEVVSTSAVVGTGENIAEILAEFSTGIRKIPRIPSVIDSQKRYRVFSVVQDATEDAVQPDSRRLYVLVDDSTAQQMQAAQSRWRIITLKIELNIDYFTHTEILRRLIPEKCAVSAYEQIGDIIHLNLSEEQQEHKDVIGRVLSYKTGLMVINKVGKIENTYRFYEYEILAGKKPDGSMCTVHAEAGVRIFLDLSRVYWCSRLQTERAKIASKIRRGEALCDPFCGAGALVLQALKNGARVYANDLNPDAIECLMKSLVLNHLACDKLSCSKAGSFLQDQFPVHIDYFVFNLPEHSLEYVKYLREFRKFRLFCFFFYKAEDDGLQPVASYASEKADCRVDVRWIREVRKVSPSKRVYLLEANDSQLFS